MNCKKTRDLLSAYYDGELPQDVVAEVDAHINECVTCAKEMASFSQLSE